MTTDVAVEVDAGVMVITMDRAAARNAMTLEMAERIAEALDELDARPEILVAVLTGSGGTFCAGMDLKRFAEQGERPAVPGRGFGGLTERPPAKPLIAAVEGWALGGGFEMMLACDLVVAAGSARFGAPEVKRGLVARGGAMLRLPGRIPRAIALELLLTGEPLGAARAEHFGLVNTVVEDGHALEGALALAHTIARNAPLAVATTKAVVVASSDWSSEEAFGRQAEYSDRVFSSADALEGATAFGERREPRWTAR